MRTLSIILSVVAGLYASAAALNGGGAALDRHRTATGVTGIIDLQVDRFVVRARNVVGLHRELKRRNRIDSSGVWRYGVTNWRILENQESRILKINVSYPFSVRRHSDAVLLKVLKKIRAHELRHSAISCEAFLQSLSETKFKSAETIFRLNADFDRRTRHGDVISR